MSADDDNITKAELEHRLQQVRDEWHAKWEGSLEHWKHESQASLEHWKYERQVEIEMFRGVISFGTTNLKALLVINGGAATVLLAFIGHIAANEGPADDAVISDLVPPMRWFLFGLLSGVVASGASYVSQFFYQHHRLWVGVPFHILAITLFVGAVAAFGWGAWLATAVFSGGIDLSAG